MDRRAVRDVSGTRVRVIEVGGGRGLPWRAWLGLCLVGLGAAFVIHAAFPRLDTDGLGAVAIGLVALGAWIVNGWRVAMWPAVAFLGYGCARVAVGLGILTGAGWTTLGVAAGLLVGWAIARALGSRATWPLVLAGIAAVVGVAQVAQQLPVVRQLEDIAAAALIIALGVMLLANARRRGAGGW